MGRCLIAGFLSICENAKMETNKNATILADFSS